VKKPTTAQKKKRILILHTGGTIGMVGEPHALRPAKDADYLLQTVPELQRLAHVEARLVDTIDSSNVNPEHWSRWLKVLKEHYNDYDGFVITHGTDTMVYTGAAFSLALKRTIKPIVFTGSQRPLVNIRTDARANLINAVEMACSGPTEVTLCFGNDLFRINRATKQSASDYIAFESYNFPALAHIGVDIDARWKKSGLEPGKAQFKDRFDSGVFSIKIFPGISGEILLHMIESPRIEAFVFESFGTGNIPIIDESVLGAIRRAQKLEKIVAIASQCPHGFVDLKRYECGVKAINAGAISAGDMTRETAVVKLMHGLGQGLSGAVLKKYFLGDVCGERSL